MAGTSLVVQWVRIHLPLQGTRFNPQYGKIPHAIEQLNQCTATTEPELYKTIHCNEKPGHCNQRKPSHSNKDPVQSKINKYANK